MTRNLLLIILFVIIHFSDLCESQCSSFTLDSFAWTVTKLTKSHKNKLKNWVPKCLSVSKVNNLKRIDITGYSKGYGNNLEKYALGRADSVRYEIEDIMEDLGYSESIIQRFKHIAHDNVVPIGGKKKSQSTPQDRKVVIWMDKKPKPPPPPAPKPKLECEKRPRAYMADLFAAAEARFLKNYKGDKRKRYACVANKLADHMENSQKYPVDDCFIEPFIPLGPNTIIKPLNPNCKSLIQYMKGNMIYHDCKEKAFGDILRQRIWGIENSIYRLKKKLFPIFYRIHPRSAMKYQRECSLGRQYLEMAFNKESIFYCYGPFIYESYIGYCKW